MKVIIEISERLFKAVKDACEDGVCGSDVWIAVAEGVPYESTTINCNDCDGYEAGYSAGLHDSKRPQGEWIELRKYDYKCSICGQSMMDKWNYCPECGAYMRGKENDQ